MEGQEVTLKEVEGQFMLSQYDGGNTKYEIHEALEVRIKDKFLGLMVEILDVGLTYEIPRLSHNWL